MKKLLPILLCLMALPLPAQLFGNAHRYTGTANDSDRGATVVTFTADADCDITTATNCTVVGNTAGFSDGQYLGTLTMTTAAGVTLSANHKVTVVGGPGRDYRAFNTTAGGKLLYVTTAGSTVAAAVPNGIAHPVYVVTGNGADYYSMGANLPIGTPVMGVDSNGVPKAASSTDVQSVIGSNVYDPYGAASAVAGTIPTTLPPSGAAGGDLCASSNYPAPLICNVGSATQSGSGGVPVHASTLKVDAMAGTASNLLATSDTNGNIGPSNIYAPTSLIPTSGVLGYLYITGDSSGTHGTMGYTTGITAACAGASTSCAIQQLNFAPTANPTTLTQTFQLGPDTHFPSNAPVDTVMHVNTLANLSPKGCAVLWTGQGGGVFFCWLATNVAVTGGTTDYQLTGVVMNYWASVAFTLDDYGSSGCNCITPTGLYGAGTILQVNEAFAASQTTMPNFIILQNQAIVYGLNACMATTNELWDCLGDGTAYYSRFDAGLNVDGSAGIQLSPGQQVGISNGAGFHVDVQFSNYVAGGCNGTLTAYLISPATYLTAQGFAYLQAPGECTDGQMGVNQGDWWIGYTDAVADPNSKELTDPVIPFIQINSRYVQADRPFYAPAVIGSGATPVISFASGSGTIAGTNHVFTVTASATGTLTATLTWAGSFLENNGTAFVTTTFAYPHRAVCRFEDETAGTFLHTTAATTTTTTFTGPVNSGDTITGDCDGY